LKTAALDVLILAGGEARRLGGADKPMVEIGGRTLLDRVIEAVQFKAAQDASRDDANADELASAHAASPLSPVSVIVVGPQRPTRHAVKWVREDPPGGGPVAAIAAGLAACSAEYVGVFAADLPFLNAATVHSLWTTLADSGEHDGAVAVDENGREQWLAAVYRRDALLAKITDQGADNLPGLPLRRLVADLRLLRITPTGQTVLDVDTWEDVDAVRRMIADPDDKRG
jgi:molybdopterin-guanine dinucleotide biosynthesis protein A